MSPRLPYVYRAELLLRPAMSVTRLSLMCDGGHSSFWVFLRAYAVAQKDQGQNIDRLFKTGSSGQTSVSLQMTATAWVLVDSATAASCPV